MSTIGKPPVSGMNCDPTKNLFGSSIMTKKECADAASFRIEETKTCALSYLDKAKRLYLQGSEAVKGAYTKVTTPVVERFNECVNDGTVRVTKGPLKGATVSEPSAICGFVKDSSEKASSAYASAKAAANACIAEGEDYGRSVLPAGEEGPIDRPHRLCGFAKAANDGYITPGMASASSAWTSFKRYVLRKNLWT